MSTRTLQIIEALKFELLPNYAFQVRSKFFRKLNRFLLMLSIAGSINHPNLTHKLFNILKQYINLILVCTPVNK